MLAIYVPPRITPLSFDQAASCMRAALRDKLGKEPTREALALALAKTALETGRYKAIWNDNFGNVKAGETYQGMFTCITLNEVLRRNGKDIVVWFAPEGELTGKGGKLVGQPIPVPDGHPQTRMRAYANEFDGAFSYIDVMADGHFAGAFQRMLVGDGAGMVHQMKLAHYFTADEAAYAKGVLSIQREYLGTLTGQHVDPHEPEDHEWEAIRAAIVGSSWERIQDALPLAGAAQREWGEAEATAEASDHKPGVA
jgi:hypothetical protein